MGGAPSHILDDSLIQGGSAVSNDKEWFEKKQITHCVSICDVSPQFSLQGKIHLNVDDCLTTDLYQYFEQTTQFIHEARGEGGNVYVHCAAGKFFKECFFRLKCLEIFGGPFPFLKNAINVATGISRSSTITLAYMMSWLEMDFETSFQELSLARVPHHHIILFK